MVIRLAFFCGVKEEINIDLKARKCGAMWLKKVQVKLSPNLTKHHAMKTYEEVEI
jgi:hypothetical protein